MFNFIDSAQACFGSHFPSAKADGNSAEKSSALLLEHYRQIFGKRQRGGFWHRTDSALKRKIVRRVYFMKIFTIFFLALLFITAANIEVSAQKRKITIILMRHAEKDRSQDDETLDPNLSAAGKERARRLAKKIKKYKPRRVFSTDYIRTRETVAPLALQRHLTTQIYDERQLKELAAEILTYRKNRRVVVVGHYNSTPALVNLLLGEEKFKPLGENEYDKIWIVRIKKGKVRVEQIVY